MAAMHNSCTDAHAFCRKHKSLKHNNFVPTLTSILPKWVLIFSVWCTKNVLVEQKKIKLRKSNILWKIKMDIRQVCLKNAVNSLVA
jgi:hypothetical protein